MQIDDLAYQIAKAFERAELECRAKCLWSETCFKRCFQRKKDQILDAFEDKFDLIIEVRR